MKLKLFNGKIELSEKNGHNPVLEILFAGDLCPIKATEKAVLEGKSQEIIAPLGPGFFDRDIAVANLEGPLTIKGKPIKKTGPNIGINPNSVDFIKTAGFDIVTLANNHIGDFGPDPVMETMINVPIPAYFMELR